MPTHLPSPRFIPSDDESQGRSLLIPIIFATNLVALVGLFLIVVRI